MKALKNFLPALMVIVVVAMATKTAEVASKAPDLTVLNSTSSIDEKQGEMQEGQQDEEKTKEKDKKEAKKPAKKPEEPAKEQPATVSHDNIDSSAYNDGTYYGTGKGFNGNITVKVTVTSKKIESIEITDHIEDGEYISRAQQSVIPAIIASQSTNVDAVSGATYSSNGIILAVRDALGKSAANKSDEPNITPQEQKKDEPDKVGEDNTDSSKYNDGTYYGVGKGFNGNITAKVTVVSKKIKEIEITNHVEDKDYLDKAKKAILPAIVKKQSTNIDAVSGATYSSNGIILAVRDALKNSVANKPNEEPPKATPQPTPTRPPRATPTPRPTSTPKPTTTPNPPGDEGGEEPELPGTAYEDGSYDGFLWGYSGYTDVTVTITDGKISNIEIVAYEDDEEYFVTCLGLVDLVIQKQTTEGIDVVSGATFSSQGILGAINHALSQAVNN